MPDSGNHHHSNPARLKHGHSYALEGKPTKEYHSYHNMKKRCLDPKSVKYPRYGGRGISICQRWMESFENFITDMGRCPTGLTLERKNNDGNYGPENCCWASHQHQSNNQSTNHHLMFDGLNLTIAQWARKTGMSRDVIRQRIGLGWPVDRALTEKPQDQSAKKLRIEHMGKSLSIRGWTRELGIGKNVISERIKRGWTPEKAVSTPVRAYPSP